MPDDTSPHLSRPASPDSDVRLPGETPLRYWFRRSGMSKSGLAKAITSLAAQRGLPQIRPDGSRVRRWIDNGERPRDPVPDLLAAVLTSQTGYPLSPADLGLAPAQPLEVACYRGPAEILTGVHQAASDTLAQGPPAIRIEYDDNEATRPEEPRQLLTALESWSWTRPGSLPAVDAHGRLGSADADRIAVHTAALREMDNLHGGASMLYMATAQLAVANNLITSGSYTEQAGRALFRELSDLCGVVGWAAHDAADYPAAVRYLTMAVHAARESEDRNLTAHLLQCLARVWGYVGHNQLARDCIALALYGARNTASPVLRAGLHALDARFAALLGAQRDALRAIHISQEIFAEDHAEETPAFVSYLDSAELYSTLGEVLLFLAKKTGTARHARDAVQLLSAAASDRAEARVRSRAFDAVALARAQLFIGDVESACAIGTQALTIGGNLDSARVRRRYRDLAREAAAYSEVPEVRALNEGLILAART